MIPVQLVSELTAVVSPENIKSDPASLDVYGRDALNKGAAPDLVVLPGSTREVAAVAKACHAVRVPMVPRGAGTGYTGGAVPAHGGVVVSLERLNRILEIDQQNLVAVVEPNAVTGDL